MLPTLAVNACASYRPEHLEPALDELLRPWQGLRSLVRPGATVLLKPNLLSARPPEQAVTTHPAVVGAMAHRCRRLGARVLIGDSPPYLIDRNIETFWSQCGLADVAPRLGAELVSFETAPRRVVHLPDWPQAGALHLTDYSFAADVVINLGKLKTHNLTRLTGAIKNHYGLLPGVQKGQLHRRVPRPNQFAHMLVDLWLHRPAHLSLLDGILGMDGSGPAGGRPVDTRILLASEDAALVDLAFAAVAGIDPWTVPTLAAARARRNGRLALTAECCTLHGVAPATLRFPGFAVPASPILERFPDFIYRLARRLLWLRPKPDNAVCRHCGRCAQICPAEAIAVDPQRIAIDGRRCIACFCCLEVCPVDAFHMQTSPALTVLFALRRWKRRWRGQPVSS